MAGEESELMRRFVFCAVVCLAAALCARGDQVELTNGDHLSGTVLGLNDGALLLRTDALGDVKIKWATVARVSADAPLYVTMNDDLLPAQVIELNDGPAAVINPEAGHLCLAHNAVQAIRTQQDETAYRAQMERLEERPVLLRYWSGSVDAGISAARGNSDTTNLNLSVRADRSTASNHFNLYLTSLQGRSRDSDGHTLTSANALRSGMRYDINMSQRVFTFGFTSFESDRVQGLDMRNVIGAGTGYRLAQTSKTVLDVFAGGSLNNEYFSESPDRRTGELLFGQDFSHTLSSRASLGTRLSLFPNISMPGDYRAVLDATASTKLIAWLGWQVTVSDIYVSNPPLGAQGNNMLLSTGLRFTFGQGRPFKPRAKVPEYKPL
jgi:putative salt-induced outer membrane protein YdiY